MSTFIELAARQYKAIVSYDYNVFGQAIEAFVQDMNLHRQRNFLLFKELFSSHKATAVYIKYQPDQDRFSVVAENTAGYEAFLRDESSSELVGIILLIRECNRKFELDISSSEIFPSWKEDLKGLLSAPNDRALFIESMCEGVLGSPLLKEMINDLFCGFFFYAAKSLLCGEYLLIENYPDKLLNTVNNNDEIEVLTERFGLFQSQKCEYEKSLKRFCLFQKSILEDRRSKPILTGSSEWLDTPTNTKDIIVLCWVPVLGSLLNLIDLDQVFISSADSIRLSSNSIYIISRLKALPVTRNMREKIENEIERPALTMAYMLLRQITKHTVPDSDDEKDWEKPEMVDEDLEKKLKIPVFINQDDSFFSKHELDEEGVFRINHEYRKGKLSDSVFSSKHSCPDERHFNNRVREECALYNEQKRVLDRISNDDEKAFSSLKALINKRKVFSASFLYYSLRYVYRHRKRYNSEEVYEVFSSLIACLTDLVADHTGRTMSPHRLLSPLRYNYYSVDPDSNNWNVKNWAWKEQIKELDTVGIFNDKPVLFFVSLCKKPVNISFMSRFLARYQVKSVELWKDVQDSHQEKMKDFIHEEIHAQRNSLLQLLGILGAFIAFVAMSVSSLGLLKTGSYSQEQIYSFLLLVSGAITIFSITIRIITLPSNKLLKTHWISICISIIIVLLILCFLFYSVCKLA